MATRKRIDIVSNGTASQYDIVMEESIEEATAFSPARALQVQGKLVSPTNPIPTLATGGLGLPNYDFVSASPNFENTTGTTTITFKRGGSGGTTVATVALTYDGSGNLVSVTKT